jgi:hypothetical protein
MLGLENPKSENSWANSILYDFPDTSITIRKSFTKLEAIYSPIPKGSSNYIDTSKTYFQPEVDRMVEQAIISVTSFPSAYNLVTKSSYDKMMQDMIASQNANATHYTEGWFYLPSRGWMWTNREAYPYFYDATDNDWMYFQTGEEKPKFYRYKTKAWLTVD